MSGTWARLAKASEVPRDLLFGGYPGFVTGGELPRGEIPVFVFHSLDPESFGSKLAYLQDNGYATLSVAEYLEALTGSRPAPERAVLLTIDDGRASVYSVGDPLLRRFGMKAVVFLVPSRVSEAAARAVPEGALQAPPANEGFLSWSEIEILMRSGRFEFESHSLSHARVPMAPEVVDFMGPELREGYASLDVPRIHANGVDLPVSEIPLGTPLLRSEPRLGEVRRFFEDETCRRAAVERVAGGGGGFFSDPNWRDELRRLMPSAIAGRIETAEEQAKAIRHELLGSKALIEKRTGGPVTRICYPWHVAGPTAERIAREVGYRAAFCGKVAGVPITLPGGNPARIARIGEDWIETLPGKRRLSALAVLRRKWRRGALGKA